MIRKNYQLLKASALELRRVLMSSNSYAAKEFLTSDLGTLLEKIITTDSIGAIDNVPKFEIMARGILPVAEFSYFNFYSLAMFDQEENVSESVA